MEFARERAPYGTQTETVYNLKIKYLMLLVFYGKSHLLWSQSVNNLFIVIGVRSRRVKKVSARLQQDFY